MRKLIQQIFADKIDFNHCIVLRYFSQYHLVAEEYSAEQKKAFDEKFAACSTPQEMGWLTLPLKFLKKMIAF